MSAEKKMERVAVLVHRVGPYHFARARGAGKVLDVTLVELFKGDDIYKWDVVSGADGFARRTLFPVQPESVRELIQGLHAALDDCQPDAVAIPGWADAVALGALQWCVLRRVPAIVMSESTEWDEPRKLWKEGIKRRLLKMCAAAFVGGQPHAEYVVKLGMPKASVFQGYDAVDNDYFSLKSDEVRNKKTEMRQKHGLPENYFLASARFVGKKNLLRLLSAYTRYRQLAEKSEDGKSAIWDLVLLGDGPLRPALESQIATLNLSEHVRLPGFKQYDELPEFYAPAKVFIHASTTEQWGLVVNEAMAAGLPVLVSNRCGCAMDLVKPGVNGFVFDPGDVENLAGLMLKISASDFPLVDFGAASRRIVADWDPKHFADGLAQAVKMAVARPPAQPSPVDRLLLELMLRK